MNNPQLEALREPFPSSAISWRVGRTNPEKTRGQALPYIDARIVQNRLDEALGAANWRDSYTEVVANGRLIAVRCTLEVRIDGEWVAKEDAAPLDASADDLALKGVYSDALKRTAVKWGVGRYLYAYKAQVVDLVNGQLPSAPVLPDEFLPSSERGRQNAVAPAQQVTESATVAGTKPAETPAPAPAVSAAQGHSLSEERVTSGDAIVDGAAKEDKAPVAVSAPAPSPATAAAPAAPAANDGAPLTDDEFIAAQPLDQQPLIKDLLVKVEKLSSSMLRGYVNGPKAKEKLSAAARDFVLRKIDEKERAAA